MDIESEWKRLAELYSGMTDEELEELAGDLTSLTDEARQMLNGEISRRGLRFPSIGPVDIKLEGKRLTDVYSGKTDEELEVLAGDQTCLSDEARLALNDEIARRGLSFISEDPLPATEEIEPGDLVTIREFKGLMDAVMAKGLLESVGIESRLIDENTVRIDWLMSNAIGGIKLQVKRQDAETAIAVLDQPLPDNSGIEGSS